MTTHRFGRTARLVAAAVALAGAALAQDDHARNQATSHHGAASMDDQQAAFDELKLPKEAVTPPPGVDPAIWTASFEEGNEPTAERVALGRKLYFDTRLSLDGKVACATCHDVTRGFSDQRMVAEGIGGQLGRRNSPTTMNAMLLVDQFWDGRARSVEHQATMPILNSIEMGEQEEAQVAERIAAIPEYASAFREAYGRPLDYQGIGDAIGAFERTLVFLDAPFDRWQAGDEEAVSEAAKRGHVLFNGKARCASCHPLNRANPLGSDNSYHNIGVSAQDQDFESLAIRALAILEEDSSEETLDELALNTDLSELGRFVVTRDYAHIGSFKTEQLRNIGVTGPYMHNGSMQTLWDVMDHYNKGGEDNHWLDGGIESLALSEAEIDDVVAFLFALTDMRFEAQNRQAFQAQQKRSRTDRPFRDEKLAQRQVLGFERRVLDSQ